MNATIAGERLRNQGIARPLHRRAADVVAWFGAVQAQEYEPAKWALGLRLPGGACNEEVERAFARGEILRTHVMRPTWHFVARADIRWLQALTAPCLRQRVRRYQQRMGLDARTLARGTSIIERALGEEQFLTRAALGERLHRAQLKIDRPPLAHLMMYAEIEAVVCSGPRQGKQFTYALVADRAPRARELPRDEALGELGRRFLQSHGPATVRDFVWWSGLKTADAKRAFDIAKAKRREADGLVYWTVDASRALWKRNSGGQGPPDWKKPDLAHLLPVYDEYLVAYRDRVAVPHSTYTQTTAPRPALIFQHALVVRGQVAGTWRPTRTPKGVSLRAAPLRPLAGPERRAVVDAAARYERFQETPVEVVL